MISCLTVWKVNLNPELQPSDPFVHGRTSSSAVWIDESRTVPGREMAGPQAQALVDEDPLGISDERDDRSRFVDDGSLLEAYSEGSGNLRLENFVSVWYLLENHQNASFNDLKTGLAYMQRQTPSSLEGPKDLLRTNLHSFLSCVDSLANLHTTLETQKQQSGWPLTRNVENKVQECSKNADGLFSEVLGRKERADATRSALSVVQRFKFLFFLPQSIKKNLEKGDYSVVLNDYTRAKSLFAESDVPLFKEALAEVEKEMAHFKETLNERLLEMPSSLDEQKKIIRYLLMLDDESDPGWDCISAHYHWLQGVLWDSQEKHWKQCCRSSAIAEADADSDYGEKLTGDTPHRFMLLDTIISEMSTKLLHFWKLAQAYVNGQLSSRQNLHKEEDIELMVIEIVKLSAWLIWNCVLPELLPTGITDKYGDRFVSWPVGKEREETVRLLQALSDIRGLLGTLSAQEFKVQHLSSLMELSVTMRVKCLSRVVDRCVENVEDLHTKETWKIASMENDWAKTQLPDLFETQISECLPYIRQILSVGNFPGERDIFEAETSIQSYLMTTLERLVGAFRYTLEKGVRLGSNSKASEGRPGSLPLGEAPGVAGGKRERQEHKRLLVALANCDYVLKVSLDSIGERLSANGVKRAGQIIQNGRKTYAGLRNVLMKTYTSVKCEKFADEVFQADYTVASEVTDVSNDVKDLVLLIVGLQAELFLVAPHFTQQISTFVVRTCTEKMVAHMKQVAPKLGPEGCTQIVLDHVAFEESLHAYLSPETKSMLHSPRCSLLKQCNQDIIQKCLERYRNRMRLVLVSLQEPSSEMADV